MWKKYRREVSVDFTDMHSEVLYNKNRFFTDLQNSTAIIDCIEQLDEDMRDVFILKYYQYKTSEIMKLKNISARRVDYLYMKAKKFLEKHI